jgi:hypothetical protein
VGGNASAISVRHGVASPRLSRRARQLRSLHNAVGIFELSCLGYLWFCALTRRRGRLLSTAVAVLLGEGVALVAAGECPLGRFQRRQGDDLPMFELWLGPRLARFTIPASTAIAIAGLAVLLARPPKTRARYLTTSCRGRTSRVRGPSTCAVAPDSVTASLI